MSDRYEPYCLADPTFYDSLAGPRTEGLGFAVAERDLPPGWQRHESDEWLSFQPSSNGRPPQGWKIHVSACLDNADRVLEAVWDHCTRRTVAFKFLRGRHVLHMRNTRYAHRGSSGKLATLYPFDDAELERTLVELGEVLHGEPGPYLLSDLRWQDGPLYVRYGSFTERYCHSSGGDLVPGIENATGQLVPDQRDAGFAPPEWVPLPEFLEPSLDARTNVHFAGIPYQVKEILHISNGGGIYWAEDTRDGSDVVLKEARPHAGLSADAEDAVTRLRRERRTLDRLVGIDGVPAVRDYFHLGEHEFLVLDHVVGTPASKVCARAYPLSNRAANAQDFAEYTRWALDLHRDLTALLAAVHARGVVHGDLRLSTVLVRPDGRPVLLDFEAATGSREARRPPAEPGFTAPPEFSGADIDHYALACVGIALFLPMTEVIRLENSKARQLAEAVCKHFPVPRTFVDEAIRALDGGSRSGDRPRPLRRRPVILGTYTDGWAHARASLAAGLVTSATPDREDRLFPGDIAQFRPGGGLNIAHGAAGVLYALSVTGCGRYASFEEWLTLRAQRTDVSTRLGFYDGLHGVAYVLNHLGHRQQALDLLDRCLQQDTRGLSCDLFGGLSGIGLNILHFAEVTADDSLLDRALQIAERVADRIGGVEDVPTVSGGEHPFAGLMRGSSGPALLFLRLFEQTGDRALLDHAATALRQDLRRCASRADGSLQVDEGSGTTTPYLSTGSAGIGMILGEYLTHRADDEFARADRAIRVSACCPFYAQSGLFNGRAGLIAYLSHRHPPGHASGTAELTSHIRRLNWHAVSYQGHLAFPGDRMLRLSMDLATGSAGVMLALGTAMHDEPVGLPLLEPGIPPADPMSTVEFPATREIS